MLGQNINIKFKIYKPKSIQSNTKPVKTTIKLTSYNTKKIYHRERLTSTMFFNLQTLSWDKEILEEFGFENLNLPEVKPSSSFFGNTDFEVFLPAKIPVTAMIGDSHAVAFGEGCFDAGSAKPRWEQIVLY